jgi:DNA-binding response OmpR family regulator
VGPCILSMGDDPHLMTVRTLLLRSAGYVVDEAYERGAALGRAQCDSVDALLICHTVPKFERRWLIANVREKRKLMPILCLTLWIHESKDEGCISVESDPEELLNALRLAIKLPGGPELRLKIGP